MGIRRGHSALLRSCVLRRVAYRPPRHISSSCVPCSQMRPSATTRMREALRMVEAERRRTAEQQAALRRYEVAFASIPGRGELGEQVLVETARSLGLREGVHFSLQTDLAGGGAARPDI